MEVGDLVRNKHTVFGGEADERGIVIELESEADKIYGHGLIKVVWFGGWMASDYETWMDSDDLEVIEK